MTQMLACAVAFFRRDAQLAVSYPFAFVMGLLSTLARVGVLWLPAQLLQGSEMFDQHGGFLPFAVVGTATMGFYTASYGGFSSAVRSEQGMGTLESVLMTRANVISIVVGSCSWTMSRAMLDTALIVGGSMFFFGLQFPGSWLAALIVILLTNLTFVGLGMCAAAFAVVYKRGDPFRPFVSGISYLLGGVIYPIEVLPGWVKVISEFLPITHGSRALRGVFIQGLSLTDQASDILALTAFAALALPAGIISFRLAIRQAQIDGTLLHY